MKYLIWSFEHRGWWRPGSMGYCNSRADAGIYDREDALAICKRANIITINEALVPITHAIGEDILPGGTQAKPDEVRNLAIDFHDTYERIAAGEGWNTNPDCRVEFDELPLQNKATMLAVAAEIYARWRVPLAGAPVDQRLYNDAMARIGELEARLKHIGEQRG